MLARARVRLAGDDNDSMSGGSGRTCRTASPRARSSSRAPSEATTGAGGGNGSVMSDTEASWDGVDDGTPDDEFVVKAGNDHDHDDMETFEEELETNPVDAVEVKIEVDALRAESTVPIEILLASYGKATTTADVPTTAGDGSGTDSSDDSDYGSDASSSSSDDEDDPMNGGAVPVKNELDPTAPAINMDPTKPNISLLPSLDNITYESALEEGARIRYEDAVFDKAWHVLQRPPKTLPRPKFPEPARNKTHWDHLLEEMKWLSGDFVRERKFRQKLAKKAAYAVQKSDLDLESRVIKKARDEALHARKTARHVGNEVMRFWMKVEKVVRFKAQSVVDAKRKTVMDKHLDFMLAQTERYSTMLATKLTGVEEGVEGADGADGAPSASTAPKPPLSLPAPDSGGSDKTHLQLSEKEDEDEFVVNDAEMEEEDDERTLEEEMRAAADEDGEDAAAEAAILAADAEVPIEELLRKYREMEEAEAKNNEGKGPTQEPEEKEEDDLTHADATFADLVEDDPAKDPNGSKTADADEDEFTVGEGEDEEDDEQTLEEEMRAAAAEDDGDAAAEAENLAKDAEVPIEELMRQYREMEAAHEQATTKCVDDANEFDENLEEEEGDDEDNEDEGPSDAEDDEPGLNSLVDDKEPELTKEENAASDARRRVLDSLAGDANSLQPKGHTIDTADVKCRVPFLLKHTLREYQHVGLNWLVSCYDKALNGILADEMGLGKTIQTISLLAYLACECGIWGPHLIVVPTSVMLNWEVEFKKWAPAFKLLTYFGTAKERKLKRQGWSKPNAFHVCITTYRLITQDARVFRRKKWKYLILDEAHMIKNWRSQRWQTLLNFNSKRRLLITGTPLQNDLMELWSLMHFLMPHVFQSHSEFKNWFSSPLSGMVEGGGGVNMDLVSRLHGVLRPFLLRRLKSEVEKNLPGKVEHVVHCGLSKRQRRLYEEYMASSDTSTTLTSGNLLGIINCLMQLRKVCNHPDLFAGRPIVSAFDMPSGLSITVPSVVARLASETERDPLSIKKLFSPKGLHLLSLEDTNFDGSFAFGGGERWTAERAQSRAVASEVVQSFLSGDDALDGSDAPASKSLGGRMTPACENAASLFLAVRNARVKVERRAVAKRIARHAFAASERIPVYGTDLRRCVKIICQARDCHATATAVNAGPFAVAPALLTMVKTPAHRTIEADDLIATFVFAIPKARAGSPSMISPTKTASMTLQSGIKNAWSQKVGWSALAPLRHAQVRRQLFFPDRRLVQFDCGKLQALATLLRQLKSGGHKVLIFTQMTKMLDILEQFLNLYGYAYCRLDGSTRPEQRQILMQRFNTDDRLFAFILSTRSGGFGINLTGADTVVFYDSDWNPAMDQQAQDRAHRIGQTREVHIYRMVCKGTIEENILKKSMQKRELDHFAIQQGNFNTEALEKISKDKSYKNVAGDKATEADALPVSTVVGGEQGAHAMSIFDQAMSRTGVSKPKDKDDKGGKKSKESSNEPNDDDEVARLMDEAQDDVDKAATVNALREENEDAIEFGDDIREKEGDEEDDVAGGSKPGSVSDLKKVGGGGGSSSALADNGAGPSNAMVTTNNPPSTPAPTDDNQTLSLTRVNTSLEGDDQFASEMMQKVQLSAQKGESLELQLKPVERYAVKYLEETVRILDDVDAAAAAIADFEEKEWELEQLEKQKAAAEAAEDDDELIIEGWETGNADDEYRRNVEEAREAAEQQAEFERLEAERWAAMYAVPSLEEEAAVNNSKETGTVGDPFAGGVPRKARSGSPAPVAGAPLRVMFRLGAKPAGARPSTLGLGDTVDDTMDRKESKKAKKHKRKREGETSEERDERRRLRRLSKDGAGGGGAALPGTAAFASPGGGRVAVSPQSLVGVIKSQSGPSPSFTIGEDAVLCALVDEFGGASWDLASGALQKDPSVCKDRFRRVVASRAASLSSLGESKQGQQLRVTPEVTKALFRATANEAFGLGGGGDGKDAPEAALELRSDVKMARSRLGGEGGVEEAKADVESAAKRFLAKTTK